MIIRQGGEDIEANRENSFILRYHNDLLNCLYIDIDDESYGTVSAHHPTFAQVLELCRMEGIEDIPVERDVDLSDVPHLWVVSALGRHLADQAEEIANQGTNNGC